LEYQFDVVAIFWSHIFGVVHREFDFVGLQFDASLAIYDGCFIIGFVVIGGVPVDGGRRDYWKKFRRRSESAVSRTQDRPGIAAVGLVSFVPGLLSYRWLFAV